MRHGLARVHGTVMYAVAGAALFFALPASAITPNANETELANLIATNAGQQRAVMTYHPILNMVARFHARDMATRSYFGHTDPDGYGSNYRVRLAELELPGYYGQNKADNNIESIAAGYSTPLETFNQWMGSPSHKQHVLGEIAFFQDQTYYGVGYYYDAGSLYGDYWVFISTPPDTGAAISDYIEWLFDRLTTAEMDDPESDPDNDEIKNLLEYAVDFDPAVADTNGCFAFTFNPTNCAGEMTVPIRLNLDTQVEVSVQTTTNLDVKDWATNGVTRAGNTFSAGAPADCKRFFRVHVSRDHP